MVTLEPMSEEIWTQWRASAVRGYAADKVRVGHWTPEEAETRAEGEFATLLPEGLASPGQHVRSIVDEGGTVVGILWFGPHDAANPGLCFIWDIEVFAEARGHGYGRDALAALEPIARDLGFDAIGLHVFGDNTVARHLYLSSGYEETDVSMRKSLR